MNLKETPSAARKYFNKFGAIIFCLFFIVIYFLSVSFFDTFLVNTDPFGLQSDPVPLLLSDWEDTLIRAGLGVFLILSTWCFFKIFTESPKQKWVWIIGVFLITALNLIRSSKKDSEGRNFLRNLTSENFVNEIQIQHVGGRSWQDTTDEIYFTTANANLMALLPDNFKKEVDSCFLDGELRGPYKKFLGVPTDNVQLMASTLLRHKNDGGKSSAFVAVVFSTTQKKGFLYRSSYVDGEASLGKVHRIENYNNTFETKECLLGADTFKIKYFSKDGKLQREVLKSYESYEEIPGSELRYNSSGDLLNDKFNVTIPSRDSRGKLINLNGYYTYKDGKLNGIAEFFWPQSKIRALSVSYKNGRRNGNFFEYDDKGQILKQEVYENGTKIK